MAVKLFQKKRSTNEEAWKFGSQKEEEILRHLQKLYREGLNATKSRREKWKNQYNYWVNAALSSRRPRYKSDIRVNYAWVTTEVKLPHMTQNMPRVNFIAFNSGKEGQAEHMSRLIGNALWHKLEINDTSEDVCWDAMIYDAGFYKVGWDAAADDGAGEIFVSAIEPFKIIADPYTKKPQNARYIIHIEPYALDELKAEYPEHSGKISPDREISQILFEERRFSDRNPQVLSGVVTDHTKFETERGFKKEYWISPRLCDQSVMEEIEEKQEIGGMDELGQPTQEMQTVKTQRPKYRKGRVITTINDAVIVEDKPHPYGHGKYPFIKQIMHKVGNEFWGIGDIEQLIPLQDALNHAYQQLDDIITRCVNIGWTADPSLGPKNIALLAEKLGIPGALKVAPLDKLKADTPPNVPQYLIGRITDLIQRVYEITGINEILQGSGRVTHRTARGIERLFEASTTRIGKSIQYYEKALKEVALQMADLAGEFYTEDRVYAVIGGNGQIAGILPTGPELVQGKFEVSIDSGAALPRDKQSKADLVFNLADKQVFQMAMSPNPIEKHTAKVILDAVEFPGREELLNFQPPPQAPPPPPPLGAPGVQTPGTPPLIPPGAAPGMPPGGENPLAAIMEMAAAAGIPPEQFLQMITAASGGG